ncbi:MAG TPA: cytochrome c [Gaiellaceae bacterium]|nr:cytochrome c [Gaiellaceae bacterium]
MRLAACVALLAALAGPAAAAVGPASGRTVFRAKCGKCHTLRAAATVARSASAGPVLTGKRETKAKIMRALGGTTGLMPTFVGVLTTKQLNDVVAFVVAATKPGAK